MYSELVINRITSLTNGIDLLKVDSQAPIEVVECGEDYIVLSILRAISKNLLVNVHATLSFKGKSSEMIANGKVVDSEPNPDGSSTVKISLHNLDHQLWMEFRRSQSAAQDQVEKIVKQIQGRDD
jgi:hypothetical protein